jgi:hypothetical protein
MAWSKQSDVHHAGGLTKSFEDRSMLSFDNIPVSIVRSRSDPRPRSSRMVSFSPVYIQARQAHS